jgi:hypothetical protein
MYFQHHLTLCNIASKVLSSESERWIVSFTELRVTILIFKGKQATQIHMDVGILNARVEHMMLHLERIVTSLQIFTWVE